MFVSEQIEYPECSSQERQTLVSEGTSSKVDLATMRMIEQQQIQQGESSSSLKHIEPYDYHTSPILGDQSRKQDDIDDSSSESSEGSLVIDEGAVSGSSSPALSLEIPTLEGEESMEEVNVPILSGRDVISSSSQLQPATTEESRKQPFSVVVQVSQEQSYDQQGQQVTVKSQRPSVIQFVSSVLQKVMSSVFGYIEKSSGETASSKAKEVKEKDQSSMSLEQGEQLAFISSCEQLQVTEACVVQEEERQQDKGAEKSLPLKKRRLQTSYYLGGCLGLPKGSSTFISGYNHKAQVCSLQNLQGILLGEVEQIKGTLKYLMLQTNKYSVREEQATDNNIPITIVHNIVKIKRIVGFPPQQVKHTPDNTSLLLSKSYVFGVMDSYKTGLERKIRSSYVGFVMAPTLTLHVGLSSNFYKK